MKDKPMKILILDDEEGILDYMSKILRLKGFDPLSALDAATAVKLFSKHRPELCLLDVHLSGSASDGVCVLEEIREIEPGAVCIMITRITDKDKVERARELGAARYLLKPIDTQELLDIVRNAAQHLRGNRFGQAFTE